MHGQRTAYVASRHSGVRHNGHKWQAYGTVEGKFHHLGVFDDEQQAAEVARAFRERMKVTVLCARAGCASEFMPCRKNHIYCTAKCARQAARDSSHPARKPCNADGCDRTDYSRGFCFMHYARLRKTGEVGPPQRLIGGGWRNSQGYHIIHRRLQHRVVMEQILGRSLRNFESVHHKNGVRHDNRPENLELWVKPQLPGQRADDLVAFVVEHYAEAVEAALDGRPQLRLLRDGHR